MNLNYPVTSPPPTNNILTHSFLMHSPSGFLMFSGIEKECIRNEWVNQLAYQLILASPEGIVFPSDIFSDFAIDTNLRSEGAHV